MVATIARMGASPDTASIVFALAAIIGGYRTYEIVFAQSYYILQARPTRLTSFTRTILFHLLFVVEISMHATVIARHVTNVSIAEALAFSFKCLTLQTDFFDPPFLAHGVNGQDWAWLLQLVYFGSNVVGIVILLGALPLIVGAAAKS